MFVPCGWCTNSFRYTNSWYGRCPSANRRAFILAHGDQCISLLQTCLLQDAVKMLRRRIDFVSVGVTFTTLVRALVSIRTDLAATRRARELFSSSFSIAVRISLPPEIKKAFWVSLPCQVSVTTRDGIRLATDIYRPFLNGVTVSSLPARDGVRHHAIELLDGCPSTLSGFGKRLSSLEEQRPASRGVQI